MSANSSMGLAGSLAVDANGLEQLKSQAKHAPDKAIAGAARQFEAMFLGMIMKSMRDATPKEGPFDSEQTKMYTAMLDQQFAQQMAARGTGLADAITRQLSRGSVSPEQAAAADPAVALQMSTLALAKLNIDTAAMATAPATPAAPNFDVQPISLDEEAWDDPLPLKHATAFSATAPAAAATAGAGASLAQTGGFVNRIWNHAVEAARSIGVRPQFMVGQAALESGWGKHEMRNADGSATHNLFGIKAGRGWNGPTVDKTTTEYVNGTAVRTTAKFRVYSSYGEAFKDYAKLIGGNPRYAGVLAQAQDAQGFARGLQQAGYATDPSYADKLVRVINGTTLRQSLAYAPPAPVLPQMLARR
jgi:flagellar protein FlgJ